ncbi:MAG: MarR family transcriptional regulator [Thermoplasmatales archaeon]
MKNEYALILEQLNSLRKFRRKILDGINASLKDINFSEFYVLNKICREANEQTMSNLSDSTGLSNALITSSVDSLEKLKLVKRKRGPDRRSYVVKLTSKGEEKCKEMEKIKNRSIESIFRNMTNDDLSELRETLRKLNVLLDKYA